MALHFEEALIENTTAFVRLENEPPPSGYSKDELIEHLEAKEHNKQKIIADNNRILNEVLRPMLASDISDADADSLFAFTQKLSSYNESLDVGLALEIHTYLINRSRKNADCDRLVRSLYNAGFIHHQINNRMIRSRIFTMHLQETIDLFTEGASYKAQYFTIENKDTRMYINRCIGNVYVAHVAKRHHDPKNTADIFIKSIDEALQFWRDEKVRAKDPDFPWESFISNAHQNICAWIDTLRNQNADNRDLALAMRVYNSYEALSANDTSVKANRFWGALRTQYVKHYASFFAGRISSDHLLRELRNLYYQVNDDDYSNEGIYGMLFIPNAIIHHLEEGKRATNQWNRREIDAIITRMINYLKNIPDNAPRHFFNPYISTCARCIGTVMDFNSCLKLIQSFTISARLTAYAHGIQVKNIAEILFAHLNDKNPELFTGICDIHQMGQAALYHDIEKPFYTDITALIPRTLYDFEIEILKIHTHIHILKGFDGDETNRVLHVIQGHHKWYDGTDGYPDGFDNTASEYKILIDLVSVANAIDSATDTLNHSFAPVLTLQEIINEIHAQAGTRYSPIIAEALKAPEVYNALSECITEGRKNNYYEAYLKMSK